MLPETQKAGLRVYPTGSRPRIRNLTAASSRIFHWNFPYEYGRHSTPLQECGSRLPNVMSGPSLQPFREFHSRR